METDEEEDSAAEVEVEAKDGVVVELVEVAAMLQGPPMTGAHRSRGNGKRLIKARVRTTIAKLSETRKWREVDSLHEFRTSKRSK